MKTPKKAAKKPKKQTMLDKNFEIRQDFSQDSVVLTTEKMSLAEEVKILIRKLWD